MSTLTPSIPSALATGFKRGRFRFEDGELEKRCCDCKEYWPADLEFFYAAKRQPDGLCNYCKACYIERRWPDGRPSQSKDKTINA